MVSNIKKRKAYIQYEVKYQFLYVNGYWVKQEDRTMLFKRGGLTTTQIIAFGFLGAIVIGTILLALPFAASNGKPTDLIDALFTATTATCVTGLTTVNTLAHWSWFGKLVIMVLVQFGGLGIITFTTTVLLVLGRRITLKERILLQDAYNLDTLSGLVRLTLTILKGTILVETIGAIFYCFVYIPEFGVISGIEKSIFNSISAFCNAGMDLVGENSLANYRGNILINLNTMMLIIIGGIGFPVWKDVIRVLRLSIKNKLSRKTIFRKLELHSKLVLTITAILLFGGALIILVLEWNNPDTLGNLPWWEKGMAAFFQSVTTRTAGFFTIPQENFGNASSFVCILLMFVGGSPSGTAGGVKTVTIGMMVLAVISIVKGRKDTEVFHRKISEDYVKKGMAVVMISLSMLIVSTIALSMTENAEFMTIIYETVSAIATVGLSKNLTPYLSVAGKLIIIITMYIGRIGPISMALFFNAKHEKRKAGSLPEEKIIVG